MDLLSRRLFRGLPALHRGLHALHRGLLVLLLGTALLALPPNFFMDAWTFFAVIFASPMGTHSGSSTVYTESLSFSMRAI